MTSRFSNFWLVSWLGASWQWNPFILLSIGITSNDEDSNANACCLKHGRRRSKLGLSLLSLCTGIMQAPMIDLVHFDLHALRELFSFFANCRSSRIWEYTSDPMLYDQPSNSNSSCSACTELIFWFVWLSFSFCKIFYSLTRHGQTIDVLGSIRYLKVNICIEPDFNGIGSDLEPNFPNLLDFYCRFHIS